MSGLIEVLEDMGAALDGAIKDIAALQAENVELKESFKRLSKVNADLAKDIRKNR